MKVVFVREFDSDRDMWEFMNSDKKQKELKAKYPSPRYTASMKMADKLLIVEEK